MTAKPKPYSWERLDRKILVNSKFVKVYEDTVRIPNTGIIFDDYTVITLNSPVLVVAVDESNCVLMLHEYRYAHNTVMPSLPAGAIDEGETLFQAAERELLEETGYKASKLQYIGELHEYPPKLDHTTRIVLATGIKKVAEPHYEPTEYVESIELVDVNKVLEMIKNNEIKTAVMATGLFMALTKHQEATNTI